MRRRVIIGVHGLSNKPPEDTLRDWWRKSITDGVHFLRGREGAPNLEDRRTILRESDFDLVYWAALMYPEPSSVGSDKQPYVEVDEGPPSRKPEWLERWRDKFEAWSGSFSKGHHGMGAPLLELWDGLRRLGLRGPISGRVEAKLRDLTRYWAEAGESIREHFRSVLLRHIGPEGDTEVLVIAHSMGTIVTYDAINDWEGSPLDKRPLTLITIGSPLGLPTVQEKLRPPPGMTSVAFPSSRVRAWFNFADPMDHIASPAHLAPYFKDAERERRVVDTLVANDFRDLDGKKNAHKSFGYLRCPEVAAAISGFLSAQEPPDLSDH